MSLHDGNSLLASLKSALQQSLHPSTRPLGEQHLMLMETSVDPLVFIPALLQIVIAQLSSNLNSSDSAAVGIAAVIYLKNAITRLWRRVQMKSFLIRLIAFFKSL